jgi:uncharacterized protein involved in exopolysaccharide biosynthesis
VRVENAITNFKETNRESLPDRIDFQMSALERAQLTMSELARDQKSLEDERRLLVFEFNMKAAKSSTGAKPASGADLAATLTSLRAELAQKSAVYSDSHPDIKALRQQIRTVEDQLRAIPAVEESQELSPEKLAELAKTDPELGLVAQKLTALDARATLLGQQRKEMEAAVARLSEIIAAGPQTEKGLNELERQQVSIQKALEDIGQKFSTAQLGERLEQDQQAERFEVIEQAVFPQEPIRPQRGKLIVLALGLAGAAGFAAVFGVEFLNRSIRSASDLANTIYHRPLVQIPYITTRRELRLRRNRIIFGAAGVATCIAAGLVGLHFLYQPLDILMFKVMSRLQI